MTKGMINVRKLMAVCLVCLGFTGGASAWADDVTDAVDQALALYADGQTQQAIAQLEFAAQLIRQQRGSGLQAYLPQPLSGWDAQAAESQSAGAAMFGGGTTATRDYSKGSSDITISIITDSPMMQSMMMLFSNPMILASQGGQLQMINGQQALVKEDGVTMVIQNTYLITIEGQASQADFVAYANAIDIDGLKNF